MRGRLLTPTRPGRTSTPVTHAADAQPSVLGDTWGRNRTATSTPSRNEQDGHGLMSNWTVQNISADVDITLADGRRIRLKPGESQGFDSACQALEFLSKRDAGVGITEQNDGTLDSLIAAGQERGGMRPGRDGPGARGAVGGRHRRPWRPRHQPLAIRPISRALRRPRPRSSSTKSPRPRHRRHPRTSAGPPRRRARHGQWPAPGATAGRWWRPR